MAAGSGYYKVVSKMRTWEGKYLAVAASTADDDTAVYVLEESYDNDYMLWERLSTRGGNGFALVNKARNLCIRRAGNGNGERLTLANLENIERDDLCVWRTEGPYGGYICLNSFADFEQKMNIPGNGPYRSGTPLIAFEWDGGAGNELWMMIEETANVSIKSIDFNLNSLHIEDQQPIVAAHQVLENRSDVEQENTVEFSFTEVSTYRFEQSSGYSISQTIEFSGGIPEIGEAKSVTTITGSFEYKTGEEKGREDRITITMPVKTPPHTTVDAQAVLLTGRLDVPYVATFLVEYPGQKPIEKTATGTFVNVKAYTIVRKIVPLGDTLGNAKRVTLRRF
jgi:hypothetical protein